MNTWQSLNHQGAKKMKAYGFRRHTEELTKGRRLRSKNRRALRRIGAGYARSKAARDLRTVIYNAVQS